VLEFLSTGEYWGEFHLAHLGLAASLAILSKEQRNIGCVLAIGVWWMAHDLHNEPNQVDIIRVYQSMGIYFFVVLGVAVTQGRHWLTSGCTLIGVSICALTFWWSEHVLYKTVSGVFFFAGSMLCVISSLRR